MKGDKTGLSSGEKKTMRTTSQFQKVGSGLQSRPDEQQTQTFPAPGKWDAEITKARQHDTWLAFEASIYQDTPAGHIPSVRARVARALAPFGLSTSDIAVDEALDHLVHKQLGAAARYFNQSGKAQFSRNHVYFSVCAYLGAIDRRRHFTHDPIHDADADPNDQAPAAIHASCLPDTDQITPDEHAARQDALRALRSLVPEKDHELYDLWLSIRGDSLRAAPDAAPRLQHLARRRGIAVKTLHRHMTELAQAIRQHPLFEELTAPFRPLRRA